MTSVEREQERLDLERDVKAVLDQAGGAKAAAGRLLARLSGGTAVQNVSALEDVLVAGQRVLTRGIFGGGGV